MILRKNFCRNTHQRLPVNAPSKLMNQTKRRRTALRRSKQTSEPSPASSPCAACTYAGCKGVIMGPCSDVLNLVHGPIGCSFYAWLTRRNQTDAVNETDANYINYCMSTDMQDSDIIFGGEKKTRSGNSGGIRSVSPSGNLNLRHLSGRSDR